MGVFGAWVRLEAACSDNCSDLASRRRIASIAAMRFYIFFCGLTILALGIAAMYLLEKTDGQGLLYGAMKLGGGLIICGLFSITMKWHGIIGAGVLALLGAAFGLGNLPGLAKFMAGDRAHGAQPLLEMGVTLICLLLLVKIIQALSRERVRRMLESEAAAEE